MAHCNNQSRRPQSLHHLQDDRLFSISGGGFMSPMRWLTEAVHRVPLVQDINVEGTMENLPDTPINDQWSDSIDVTPESNQPIGDNTINY